MQWNLNTLLISGSLVALIGGWGWAWGDVQNTVNAHDGRLTRLETRVSGVETDNRRLDNHELRISNAEGRASDTNNAMRSLESTMNSMAGDMKVMREILQRVEQRSGNRSQQ